MMLEDIAYAKKLGVQGIVIGALTPESHLDTAFIEACIEEATDLDLTFHMAFDAIVATQQLAAIDWLAAHGFSRILTHGSDNGGPIENNIARLQQYIAYAAQRIVIMPGGGITSQNLPYLTKKLATNEFHGTKIV